VIKFDKRLEKFRGKILFPKKLAMANEMLSKAELPKPQTSNSCTERSRSVKP